VHPWTDPAWREAADTWIAGQLAALGLEPLGQSDQLHVRPWATVIRIPTSGGDVFFKANAPALRYEAPLLELLVARQPGCMPELLALEPEQGWLLMADAGVTLRELIAVEGDLGRWLDVLPLYAEAQLGLMGDVEQLIGVGVPDLRLGSLPALAERLIDDVDLPAGARRRLAGLLPGVESMCEELESYGVPDSIQHDDLHDAQVFVRDGTYRLLDWGDACVSHPFFTMAVTLDGVIAWGVDDVEGSLDTTPFRDAYLEPFTALAGRADLVAACTLARRLGWLCRAVNGQRAESDAESTRRRLSMFLDGHV
jgi:hypothetical protein